MAVKLTWNGKQVTEQIKQALADALTEIDLRIETVAKEQLYEGHGKRFGTLRRSIEGAPGRIEGAKVRGSVGTKGVKYALPMHRKYRYIAIGLERVRPQALAIIAKHIKRASGGS